LPSWKTGPYYSVVRAGSSLTVYSQGRKWAKKNWGEFDVLIDQVNTVPFGLNRLNLDVPVLGLFYQTAEDVWPYNSPWPVSWIGRRMLEPRWLRSFSDTPCLALSESTALALERFGVKDPTILGGALSDMPASPAVVVKSPSPRVVALSRLVGYKRVDHVIEAVARARRLISDLELDVVGDGPLRRRLEASAPNWVVFHGAVDECRKSELLAASWFHIACSVREGWGLTVTEASVLGVPTIAYAAPGLVDSVTAAQGYLAPQSPTALGDMIVDLVESRAHEGDEPPPLGGALSWTQIADTFEEALVSALASTST